MWVENSILEYRAVVIIKYIQRMRMLYTYSSIRYLIGTQEKQLKVLPLGKMNSNCLKCLLNSAVDHA